jgi:hypothetical protein
MWKMSTVNLTTYLITMDDLMRVYELAWCKLLTSMQHFHRFYQECHFLYWTILIYFCNLKKKIWKENEIRGSIAKIIYIGNKLKFLIMLIPLFRHANSYTLIKSSIVIKYVVKLTVLIFHIDYIYYWVSLYSALVHFIIHYFYVVHLKYG